MNPAEYFMMLPSRLMS